MAVSALKNSWLYQSGIIAIFSVLIFLCVFSDQMIAYNKNIHTIWIYNIHNKETLKVTYKVDGKYLASAMKKVNHIMRDWRQNKARVMRPDLIDLMWEMHTQLGSRKPIYLISGYRSQKTNRRLRRKGGGQAKFSRHILGMAADVHFPDIPVRELRDSTLIRQRGGVGYYPTSGLPFVHMDVGRVRHWPRLSRPQLAALFPGGRSHHVPRDGRPLTKKDATRYGAKKYVAKLQRIQLARRARLAGQGEIAVASLETPKPSTRPKKKQQNARTIIAALTPKPTINRATNKRQANDQPPVPQIAPKGLPKEPQPPKEIWWRGTTIAGLLPQHTKTEEGKLVQLASIDPYAPKDWQSFKPRSKPKIIHQDVVAYSPEFDAEHPEEFNYRPFSLTPLMTDLPVAFNNDIAKLSPPDYAETSVILRDDDTTIIPAKFRPGLQFGQMMWANQFVGEAVTNLANPDRPLSEKIGTANR